MDVFDATHDNAVVVIKECDTVSKCEINWHSTSLARKTLKCVDLDEKTHIETAAILEQGDDIRIVLVCALRAEVDLVRFTEVIYIDPRSDTLVSRKPFTNGCRYKHGVGRFVMAKSKSGTAVFVASKCNFDEPDCLGAHPSFAIFEATFEDFVVRVFDSTLELNAPVNGNNSQIKSIDLETNRAILCIGGIVESQIYTTAGTFVPPTDYDLSACADCACVQCVGGRCARGECSCGDCTCFDELMAIDPESGCCIWQTDSSRVFVTSTVFYEHKEHYKFDTDLNAMSNAVFIRDRLWVVAFRGDSSIVGYCDFGEADTKPCM